MSQHARQPAERVPIRTVLSRLWRLPTVAENPTALTLYRAWLVTFPISIVSMLVVTVAIALWLIRRQNLIPGGVLFDLVAVGILPSIFRQSLWLWLAFRKGFWTRKGAAIRRDEQPCRYWSWTGAMLLVTAIWTGAAVFLVVMGATI